MFAPLRSQVIRLCYQLPRLAIALSNNPIQAVFLYIKLAYFTISRKTFARNKPLKFTFNFAGRTFVLDLLNNLDLAALVEIYVLKEYEWTPDHEVKTILDLGAHWGDTATYYAVRFPDAQIYSFEPEPEVFARLQKVTAQFSNIKTFNYALAEQTGTAEFGVSKNLLGNSLTMRDQTTHTIQVNTLSVDDIMSMCKVEQFDLIKFDIEGAEEVLLQHPHLEKIGKAYIGEIHIDLMDLDLNGVKNAFNSFDTELLDLGKENKTRYIVKAR